MSQIVTAESIFVGSVAKSNVGRSVKYSGTYSRK